MVDYEQLEYYDELFNDYYNYMKEHSKYNLNIEKKSPPNIVKFPTIVLKEVQNVNAIGGTSTNRQELVDLLTFQADIYTKDLIDENGEHPSLEVQKELKLLTFNFFFHRRFDRTSSDNWENNNIVYDRLTLLFQGRLQSWNKQIM